VALRWAINADGEGGLSLILQALPATAASLNSRPTFKRDICPGIPLVNIPISVEIDYNHGLIGPRPRLFSTAPDTTNRVLGTSRSSRHNTSKGNLTKVFIIYISCIKTVVNPYTYLCTKTYNYCFRHRLTTQKTARQRAIFTTRCHHIHRKPSVHRGRIPLRRGWRV